MDVLNPSPSLCLPQAMWLIHRVIMAKPDLDQVEVLGLVTPQSMRARTPQDGAHARRALAGLIEFRLVQEVGGLLQAESLKTPQDFLRELRRRLVVPPVEMGESYRGAPDLRAALVWLMRQSPLESLHYEVNVQTNMPTGLFTNDTRWNGFRWWSEALGFGQLALKSLDRGGGAKTKIIPNPSVAVMDAIAHPFGDPLPRNEHIPVDRFVDFLRAELPVLPGHPSATYEGFVDGGDRVIAALGLALATAEQRQILKMDYQSDPSSVLALPRGQHRGQARYVSSVTVKGGNR